MSALCCELQRTISISPSCTGDQQSTTCTHTSIRDYLTTDDLYSLIGLRTVDGNRKGIRLDRLFTSIMMLYQYIPVLNRIKSTFSRDSLSALFLNASYYLIAILRDAMFVWNPVDSLDVSILWTELVVLS